MSYFLEVARKAQKDLSLLAEKEFRRIDIAISNLSSMPRPVGVKKLVNSEFWRIRVGRYRIIYKIDDIERRVKVERVLHRKQAYRKIYAYRPKTRRGIN